MASLSQFSSRMARIAVNIPEQADKAVRKAALACDQAIVMATPVDTGRARSNWIASLNTASGDEVDPYAPGQEGSTAGANTQAALEQAQAVVAGYDGDRHSSVHITNNLPYIGPLNDGHSAQAPAGFVSTGVQAGVAAVKTVRILDGN